MAQSHTLSLQMEMILIPLVRLPPTVVTLDFLWLVIATGHVLEMVAALLVPLAEWHQLVKV